MRNVGYRFNPELIEDEEDPLENKLENKMDQVTVSTPSNMTRFSSRR